MLEMGHQLMIGTQILMKALKVSKAVIGIEANKPDAIEYLTKLTAEYTGISIQPLKVKYPQGGEKQLIKAITGREVPSGGLPIAVGAVVQNIGTTIAVYNAVQKNKPLIERTITISGKNLATPKNYIVRTGTLLSDLAEQVGGMPEGTGKIIAGGPMTGKALSTLDAPVIKGTSGLLFFKEEEAKRQEVNDCIRCSKCITVCPMGLEPYLLMTVVEKSMFDKAEQERTLDCIECGSCSFICPAHRPLLDYIRLGKKEVTNIIRSRK